MPSSRSRRVVRFVRPATLTIGMSGGKPNARQFLTSPWRVWPGMFCQHLKCISEKKLFDCVVLCVDQHSGYIVAVPLRKKGFLAKEVAVMMFRHWLTVFGVPRTICSACGPLFTGRWFKAMCFLMEIWHAKSVAYPSRCTRLAEVA